MEVEYALRSIQKPMGVAECQLLSSLPEELVNQLPSPEELKYQLRRKIEQKSK